MLVDNYLYAVVSLPAGVFNPYSGVKTSILLMDKEVAKKRDDILFIKIDNDGYNLGGTAPSKSFNFAVKGSHGDCNLSGERYKLNSNIAQTYFKKSTAGGAMPALTFGIVKELQIPLPQKSIQEEIVAEIEGYQKIIDGAKAVVANYKPKIDIDPDWEMVELDSIAELIIGNAFSSSDFRDGNPIRCIKITNVGVRELLMMTQADCPNHILSNTQDLR
jgi:hypothetical protein